MIYYSAISLELLLLVIQFVLAAGACFYLFTVFFGAPFIPTPMSIIKELIQIAKISKDDVVADLGSGDGRMLICAARHGAIAKGWEINPLLVLWTCLAARRNRVEKSVTVYLQNYHKADLADATVIFLYGFSPHMPKLEQKLRKDLRKGTKIISYKFTFPTLQPIATPKPGIFIYII